LSLAISLVDSSLARAQVNLAHPLAKIDCLPLQIPHSLHCAMQPEKVHSYIDDKAINESALLLQNVYQAYEIQFQLVRLLLCKPVLLHKYF
jgi:hypothetical protein